jgi:hypothetical protein
LPTGNAIFKKMKKKNIFLIGGLPAFLFLLSLLILFIRFNKLKSNTLVDQNYKKVTVTNEQGKTAEAPWGLLPDSPDADMPSAFFATGVFYNSHPETLDIKNSDGSSNKIDVFVMNIGIPMKNGTILAVKGIALGDKVGIIYSVDNKQFDLRVTSEVMKRLEVYKDHQIKFTLSDLLPPEQLKNYYEKRKGSKFVSEPIYLQQKDLLSLNLFNAKDLKKALENQEYMPKEYVVYVHSVNLNP